MIHDNVPSFVSQMEQIKELFDILQAEVDTITNKIENIVRQFYIKSTDFNIPEWEKDFHIEVNDNLAIEVRRARVMAKINTRTPASQAMLENLVFQILQPKEVYIINKPEAYEFDIYVVTGCTTIDVGNADVAVADARPAHLFYKFVISVNKSFFTNAYMQFGSQKYKETNQKSILKVL